MQQGDQKLSAPQKRLLALMTLALGVLLYEGLQPGFGPSAPVTDPLLAILLGAALAALCCSSKVSSAGAALLLVLPTLAAPPLALPVDEASNSGDADRVLITVDTWRADHAFDLPGWRVYENAVAPSSWTLPSMDSLMRGQPVRRHRGGLPAEGGFSRPDPSIAMLAEQIPGRSAAFVCNPYLRSEFGYDRGFDRFEHADSWRERFGVFHFLRQWRKRSLGGVERQRARRDGHLVDEAIAWWQANEKGRFLWVHLLGPHEYTRDERTSEAYGRAVKETEGQVRRLLDALDDDARVVLTSDHGESLGEKAIWGHGSSFRSEQVAVPLAVRGPPAGTYYNQTSLTDVADFLMTGDPKPLDRGRPVVELGGHHTEVAWAIRMPDGSLGDRGGPSPTEGQPIDPELEAILLELGYQTP
jgi:hypothetical protein